jgi:hypothetical protein
MAFEDQHKALVFFHLEKHTSGNTLGHGGKEVILKNNALNNRC